MIDPSLPSLMLDDGLYPDVLSGVITASIRIGDRPIETGRIMFAATNGGYLPIIVYVTSVIHTTFVGIADVHAKRAGYRDAEDAMAALRVFYPEAKLDTPMTVLLFERVY